MLTSTDTFGVSAGSFGSEMSLTSPSMLANAPSRIRTLSPFSKSSLTFRSMAALIDSSRPDWTLMTYHFFGDAGSDGATTGVGSPPSSAAVAVSTGGSAGGGVSATAVAASPPGIVSSSVMVMFSAG